MEHKIQKISGPLRGRITYEERKNEMATEFLNDARKEIEGRTEDFCGELKAFYQGNGEAEQNLMEQTKSAPEQKKTAAAGTDGGYGDAGTGTTGGL